MFSTVQKDCSISLINQYKSMGYKYYIVHTNTYNYNSYDTYDLTFYFTQEPIYPSVDNYAYMFKLPNTGDKVKVEVNTKNYNFNSSQSSTERIGVDKCNEIDLAIDVVEFVSSNAVGYDGMNFISYQDNSVAYNLNVNDIYISSVLLTIILLFMWLGRWFGHAKGDDY